MSITIPVKELHFKYATSPGPGGQNVNRVKTKVILFWPVFVSKIDIDDQIKNRFIALNSAKINKSGELVLSSSRYRDQGRNVADVLEKLKKLLDEAAIIPKPRKKKKISAGAKERRIRDKKLRSQKKERRRKDWES